MFKRFLKLPRRHKQIIAVVTDYVMLLFAFWSALALRFETLTPDLGTYRWQMFVAPLLAIPIFVRLGLYRAVVRFMEDRVVFVVASGATISVILLASLVALTHTPMLSRGVFGIYWLQAIVYVGMTRFLARSLFLRAERKQDSRKRVVIYGAGRSGTQLLYALRAGREYLPVAFFDDKVSIQQTELAGLRVHAPSLLPEFLTDKHIDEVLLAIPSAGRARRAQIISRLEGLHCRLKLVPSMSELVNGNVTVDAIREVELEDLLGRDIVAPDSTLLGKCITGKVVLVTGAGGSIGSELCRQIVRLGPARLVLMELSEFALYSVEQELTSLCAKLHVRVDIIALLGSVIYAQRDERIMKTFGVQTVYHAAAYKHVPLVEHNPVEGVRNNVLGTRRMAEAALSAGVETFILISTDKAVRPTNVMGASKRLAELVLQGLARRGCSTRFCMVRFGNVLGSSGSVVPLFRRQIAARQAITLTHPEITRYFMTIPEAAQLVIQAGSMAMGGEVYVLDMGEPVKIIDLARRMIRLSGLSVRDEDNPQGDIPIEVVGLRPGEKLYEELLIGENVEGTSHPLIMRAYEHELPWVLLDKRLDDLDLACQSFDYRQVLAILISLVHEYTAVSPEEFDLLWHAMVQDETGPRSVH